MNNFRDWILTGKSPEAPLLRDKGKRAQPSAAAEGASFAGVPVKREAIRQANHRDGDRHRLPDEAIGIVHDGKEQVVTLVNLSGGGAMIEGAKGLKLWDHLLLRLGDCGQVEAAVRWVRGERLGLEFAHETRIEASREETERMLRAVINRSFPDVVAKAERSAGQQPSALQPQVESKAANPRGENDVARELRHPLIWSGLVHYDHQSVDVRLRNISEGGALIECELALRVGADLLLEIDKAGTLFATVNWARGDAAGLRFHQPFDLQNLSSARPTIASQRWVAPDYLRDSHSASGPWARQWGRSDLHALHDRLGSGA